MVNNKINVEIIDGLQPILDKVIDYKNITNCITNIQQDIKLEKDNGYIVLKAGSKFYVPNGKDTFDVYTTDIDYTIDSIASSGMAVVSINSSTNEIVRLTTIKNSESGSAEPIYIENLKGWYDTENNQIVRYLSGELQSDLRFSLPLCLFTSDETEIVSIDKIFNGFGYIGSTVFALPGVKGLIPNGRNINGTMQNIEFEITKVITTTSNDSSFDKTPFMVSSDGIFYNNEYSYNTDNNFNYKGSETVEACVCGYVGWENGVITSFASKMPFRTTDYQDVAKLKEENVFEKPIYAPTPDTSDNSTQVSNTAWFRNNMRVVGDLVDEPATNVFYFLRER